MLANLAIMMKMKRQKYEPRSMRVDDGIVLVIADRRYWIDKS